MKNGGKNLRKNNRLLIFLIGFIIFIIFFILSLPSYIIMKSIDSYKYCFPNLWKKVDCFLFSTKFIKDFSNYIVFKIPEWTMPVAVIINGINMFFGFKDYKKKWWYCIILLISIFISIMLIDCWYILYTMP